MLEKAPTAFRHVIVGAGMTKEEESLNLKEK